LRTQVEKLADRKHSDDVVAAAKGERAVEVPTDCKLEEQGPAPLSPVVPPVQKKRRRLFGRRKAREAAPATGTLSRTYEPIAPLPQDVHPRVLILPARDEPDEIAGVMLSRVLINAGYDATCMSIAALAGEMVNKAMQADADLIIISATPPSAVAHAKYLVKLLERAEAGDQRPPCMATLWSRRLDPQRLSRQIHPNGHIPVATTLCEAIERVRQIALPRVTLAATRKETKPLSEAISRTHLAEGSTPVRES
jgi:hypothetical protein